MLGALIGGMAKMGAAAKAMPSGFIRGMMPKTPATLFGEGFGALGLSQLKNIFGKSPISSSFPGGGMAGGSQFGDLFSTMRGLSDTYKFFKQFTGSGSSSSGIPANESGQTPYDSPNFGIAAMGNQDFRPMGMGGGKQQNLMDLIKAIQLLQLTHPLNKRKAQRNVNF